MQVKINTVQELGLIIRAVRKNDRLRADDLAGIAKVGHVFVRDVERGKETVQLGRVLRLLNELGIFFTVDVDPRHFPMLEKIKAKGLKPLPKRKPPAKIVKENDSSIS